MIIDRIENLGRYANAFLGGGQLAAYLAALPNRELEPGSHPVPGTNLTINVSQYQPRDPASVRWEAHRHHMDVHLMLRGDEAFGWLPTNALTATPDYDSAADTALYNDQAPGSVMIVPEGFFVIVWPWDAHRPTMASGNDGAVRLKGVVKVEVRAEP